MRTIIAKGKIFDAIDGLLKENGFIIIEDGKISQILPPTAQMPLEEGDTYYDLSEIEGACILPGLIDAHLHLAFSGVDKREKADSLSYRQLRFSHNAIVNLLNGITTVRDCGAADGVDINYKRAFKQKLLIGSRVYNCGEPIIATGGHCTYMGRQIDGPYEARKGVREQLNKIVDFIKVMVTGGLTTPTATPTTPQLTTDELEAIIETAHMNGKYVSGHIEGGPALITSIKLGLDTVEHGIYLTEKDVECMSDTNTPYIPTLTAIYSIATEGAQEVIPIDAISIKKCQDALPNHRKSFKMAMEAGLLIGAGTDYKHGQLGKELGLMVELGMSPKEALFTATKNAAKIMGITDILGDISVGKIADIIVIKGNPLTDIANVNNIEMVFLDGKMVVKGDLLLCPQQFIAEPMQPLSNNGGRN